tara:strand:+ start:4934 stop:6088 length:1155 start_codon:yes stop_codon:yes gene_type:complete
MKITDIEMFEVSLPLRRPHTYASLGAQTLGNYLIIRLNTDKGISGLGEGPVVPTWGGDHMTYFGESISTAKVVIQDFLKPAISGQDPHEISYILELMDRVIVGYPFAKAAIDMAIHDIVGKDLGVPVYQLLGGRYRSHIPLAHSIGLLETERAVEEAKVVVGEGIKTVKLKIGHDPQRDLDVVKGVREAIGEKIEITVDANEGYKSPKIAIRIIKQMERYGVSIAEQPVKGLEAMARVAEGVDTPIMADESAWTPQDVARIKETRAADIISIYTTKPGGLHNALKVAHVAEAFGFPCNLNGSIETGVGNAANVAMAAAARPISLPCVFPLTTIRGKEQTKMAGVYYVDDLITEPFRYDNGTVIPSDKPGLGIELDESKLEKYAP